MRRGFHRTTSSYSSFNRLRPGCGVLTMSTSAHLTNRSRTGRALGDFISSVMPRLLRLARCQGYGSAACGCGAIWWPCLQRSPLGGSTLMTSAPKSPRITAALGPAMKLARSTTLSPEKMLSLAISYSAQSPRAAGCLPPVELGRASFEEGLGALLLVLGRRTQAEVGRLEQHPFVLAGFQAPVRRLEGELDRDRCVGSDLLQDGFRPRNEIRRRNDLVDQPDAPCLPRVDHLPGQNELQRSTLADQPREPLRSASTGKQTQLDLRLTERRVLDGDPECACHRSLAAAAQRKTVDGRDHRLSQVFDEVENVLAESARPRCLESRERRKLGDVGARDERLVAGAREDRATDGDVVAYILERRAQILPCRRVQRIERFRAIDRHVRDAVTLFVQNVLELQSGR